MTGWREAGGTAPHPPGSWQYWFLRLRGKPGWVRSHLLNPAKGWPGAGQQSSLGALFQHGYCGWLSGLSNARQVSIGLRFGETQILGANLGELVPGAQAGQWQGRTDA